MHQEFNSRASLRFHPYQLQAARKLLRRLLDDQDFLGNVRLLVHLSLVSISESWHLGLTLFLPAIQGTSSWLPHMDSKPIQNQILTLLWPKPLSTLPWERSFQERSWLTYSRFWSMYHPGFQVLGSKGMPSNGESYLYLCKTHHLQMWNVGWYIFLCLLPQLFKFFFRQTERLVHHFVHTAWARSMNNLTSTKNIILNPLQALCT